MKHSLRTRDSSCNKGGNQNYTQAMAEDDETDEGGCLLIHSPWDQTQITAHSTSHHSTTSLSDQKLVGTNLLIHSPWDQTQITVHFTSRHSTTSLLGQKLVGMILWEA